MDTSENENKVEIPNHPLPTVVANNKKDECVLIDRTNEGSRAIGEGYELPPSLLYLYLTNNRIKKIENLAGCTGIKELVLRQNAISVIEGLDTLTEVEEVDLYMNAITSIPGDAFRGNPRLTKLDLSFNELGTIADFPSANFVVLEELYLIHNRIKTLERISIPTLKLLELGDNRIRTMENLDGLPGLDSLWLGRNKVRTIENLEALVNLRKLSLQSNRITKISGLDHLTKLEELYLSHNGIQSMDGIENLTSLRILDLAENQIVHLRHLKQLTKLTDLWMNGNQLTNLDELNQLTDATELDTVYLEGNPLAKEKDYKQKVIQVLPMLKQLDADMLPQRSSAATTSNGT